jgi:hypothetical protein
MSPATSIANDPAETSTASPDAAPNSSDAPALQSAGADADGGAGNGNVGEPVSPCASQHWITISLVRAPDLEARPDWWPPAQSGPYASEQYNADLTNGSKAGALDDQGSVNATQIPAGTCEFQGSKQFYDEIEQFFTAQLGDGQSSASPSGDDSSTPSQPDGSQGEQDGSDSQAGYTQSSGG